MRKIAVVICVCVLAVACTSKQATSSAAQGASTGGATPGNDTGSTSGSTGSSDGAGGGTVDGTGGVPVITGGSPPRGPEIQLSGALSFTTASAAVLGSIAPDTDGSDVVSATYALNGAPAATLSLDAGTFHIDVSLRPGPNALEVTASDRTGRTRAASFPLFLATGQPSTSDLVRAAEASGAISAEQSLIYRVYALFADPRLPVEFQGDDSQAGLGDAQALIELKQALPTLSDAARDAVAIYLLPPYYRPAPVQSSGAWRDPSIPALRAPARSSGDAAPCTASDVWSGFGYLGNGSNPDCPIDKSWTSISGAEIKVWYPSAQSAVYGPLAQSVIDVLEGPIQGAQKLKDLMGVSPIRDSGAGDLLNNAGGDDRLDIVLVPSTSPRNGATMPRSLTNTQPTSTYIVLWYAGNTNLLISNAVHEYMHALQWARKVNSSNIVNSYLTMAESTAQWASHYVLADYGYRSHWMANRVAFEHIKDGLFSKSDDMPYGAWLFALYLHKEVAGTSYVIRQLWDAAETLDEIDAYKKVLADWKYSFTPGVGPDGAYIAGVWSDFVATLWNRGPQNDLTKWLGAPAGTGALPNVQIDLTGEPIEATLGGKKDVSASMSVTLPSLSARYYHFTFPDPLARTVIFYDGLKQKLTLAKRDGDYQKGYVRYSPVQLPWDASADVQVLAKIGGVWKQLYWPLVTSGPQVYTRFFCRDKASERIEELVIIDSNSSSNHALDAADQKPVLWASNMGCFQWEGDASVSWTGSGSVVQTNSYHIVWQRDPADSFDNFRPKSGTAQWSIAGDDGRCSYSGQGSWPLSNGSGQFYTFPQDVQGPNYRAFAGAIWPGSHDVTYTKTCRHPYESESGVFNAAGGLDFVTPGEDEPDPLFRATDAGGLAGTLDPTWWPEYSGRLQWSFDPVREP